MSAHIDQIELLQFIAGSATEESAERIFEHLDSCTACSRRETALRSIRGDFERAWEAFVSSLAGHVDAQPEPGVVLRLRGLTDSVRRMTVLSPVFAEANWNAPLQPLHQGAASVSPDEDLLRREAHVKIGGPDPDSALEAWANLAAASSAARAHVTVALEQEGTRVGMLAIDAERQVLSVLAEPGSSNTLLVYIRTTGGVTTLQPQEVEGAAYMLAEMPNLPRSFHVEVCVRPSGS